MYSYLSYPSSTDQRSIFAYIVTEKVVIPIENRSTVNFMYLYLSDYGCIISVNESTVHFHTYSPGKKWSYPSSTDQRSISCSYISQAMVVSSVSTNQRSIFTHIVPEENGHTHRQQINGLF